MLRFDKYEGLGNDFVVIDLPPERAIGTDAAARLCDRHFGVGADGILLLTAPVSPASAARMVVINADGSRPEMCGNGLRCVALHAARRAGAHTGRYLIETDAGALACEVERQGDAGRVRIELGRASAEGSYDAAYGQETLSFARISIGNPHAILFDSHWDDAAIDRIGPLVSGGLPGGSNVEFVRQPAPSSLDLVVWERGVGRTLACGTGAAATVAAAALAGRAPYSEPVEVRLPGGALEITVTPALDVSLRGPARWVFSGELAEP